VVSGQCWLLVEDIPDPVRLKKGDCILLPTKRSFRVASDLTLTPVDVKSLLSLPLNGRIASCNGGGDCFIVGGHFTLSGDHAGILLGILPAIVHLRTERDRAELRWSLDRMNRELRAQRPGGLLVAQHLAHMMLVQAIRLHLEGSSQDSVGWLFALADKQLSAAMQAMHADPARHWTLQMLAERAGMSRTIFASRFKETVGSSVMDYLSRWRMLLAGDKLHHSKAPTPLSPCRSDTNPKAHSAKPSNGAWVVHRDSTQDKAVQRIPYVAERKPLMPAQPSPVKHSMCLDTDSA